MAQIHVSISAEPSFHLGNIEITNSMITGVVICILIVIFALRTSRKLEKSKHPKGIQNLIEMVFEGLFKFMADIAGDQKTKEFFPVIATLLIYILLCNWSGLLPGVGT